MPGLPAKRVLAVACWLLGLASATAGSAPVVFNRDVRPILSDTCFNCHGPDKAKRKAGLRLDVEPSTARSGARVIVPGKPEASELYRRLTTADPKEHMPPPASGRRLTPAQVGVIRRWIEQGGKWQKHWAFIPPERLPPPAAPAAARGWARNPIDLFVLDRLAHEGLAPAPEADPVTLLRRVTLDLTGLPPTPAEVDAFLADRRADAYERAVERLLASPRYGERMAVHWLDAARYADTNGYQSDGERTMWRWRDWVIDAFNSNMPFDRFTVEQLAGDLLPHATLEQKIASGFNRNHRGNGEGGIIPEEYAVEYVVDRVDTTATIWLGLTMGCARCHDHKFDPVRQQEFYRVYAFFNNVPERGKAVKYGNSPPMIKAPTRAQRERLAELDRRLTAAGAVCRRLEPALAAAQSAWEHQVVAGPTADWTVTRALLARYPLDGATAGTGSGCKSAHFEGGAPAYGPGRIGRAAELDGRRFLDAGNVGAFGFYDKFSCGAWVYPEGPHGGTVLSRMTDVPRGDGYYLVLDNGHVQVNLVKRWLDDSLRVETVRALEPGRWHHVFMTYDGSRVAPGLKIYVDGRPEPLKVNLDDLNQSFVSKEPLRIGAGNGPAGRFHGRIADVRVYGTALEPAEVAAVAAAEPVNALAALPPTCRTPAQAEKLRAAFLATAAPEPLRRAYTQCTELRRRRERLVESFPTTMVMEEMPRPRDAYVLIRGQYDKPGAKVTRGVPASLSPWPAGAPLNRLGFARWLVDPANPLTARVTVNRYWQTFFGAGLVRTAEDFGSQGEWPTHPELLDWLATEFVRAGWDVKAMQRLIVTSASYRQSSKATPELLQRDPENRLLARGPRFRLPAEAVRDQALAAAGLLVEKPGGPSVKPYQPPGLWKELADTEYVQDHGKDLYRRGLYTFWKRTVAPPSLANFDAAGRETCVVRETRTNTPLQALDLMNDVTYVEAARVLAQRVLLEAGPAPADRITRAFRLVTARTPRPAELTVLLGDLADHLARYRADRAAAVRLVSAGEAPRDPRVDVAELAAYTATANLILNLDEAVTKE